MKLFVVHILQQYAKQFLVKFLYRYSSSSLPLKVSIYRERYWTMWASYVSPLSLNNYAIKNYSHFTLSLDIVNYLYLGCSLPSHMSGFVGFLTVS